MYYTTNGFVNNNNNMTYQLPPTTTTKHNVTSITTPIVPHSHLTPRLDEYFRDTLQHLLSRERDTPVRTDYIQLQPEVTPESRQTLLDWLLKAHFAYELSPNTIFISVGLLDRFLSIEQIQTGEIQLLGLVCLQIASKLEDSLPLTSRDLSHTVGGYCTAKHIASAERNVLRVLKHRISFPSSLSFLEMLTETLPLPLEPYCYFLARYMLELLLCDQTGAIRMRPSLQASVCMSLALGTVSAEGDIWVPPSWFLVSQEELLEGVRHLKGVYVSAMGTKNHAVRLKFSTRDFHGVALSLCQAV